MAKAVAALAALLLVVVVAAMPMRAGGAPPPPPQCDASTLSPCAFAFTFGGTPSDLCCDKLREEEQKGCLCVYARDPAYSSFLNSTTARNALAYCKVAFPTC